MIQAATRSWAVKQWILYLVQYICARKWNWTSCKCAAVAHLCQLWKTINTIRRLSFQIPQILRYYQLQGANSHSAGKETSRHLWYRNQVSWLPDPILCQMNSDVTLRYFKINFNIIFSCCIPPSCPFPSHISNKPLINFSFPPLILHVSSSCCTVLVNST